MSASNAVRVLIADDHPLVVGGLRQAVLAAASDAELSQNLGDMNLDRRDGDIEFVSDMLVLKTSTNHVENTKLLGCQARQLRQQVLNFRAGAPGCRTVPRLAVRG